MSRILTLTVNPVVDKSTTIPSLIPNQKLNCTEPIFYSGGGGINVSRAIKNLGGESTALYLSGGRTGNHLQELLSKDSIDQCIINLKDNTRENLSVYDTNSDLQYRFGLPGPFVQKHEWQNSLEQIQGLLNENDFLVASGKLTAGIPDNYYKLVGDIVKRKKAKFVVDTKGRALAPAITSEMYLFKPNLNELASLYNEQTLSTKSLEEATKKFMATHACEIMVISLGKRGALLVTSNLFQYIAAPIVDEKNTIGAGDSMLAGMLIKAQAGKNAKVMTKYGIACGAAATLKRGTKLCQLKDVEPIFKWLRRNVKI